MILEFQTQPEAEAALAIINAMAENWWADQGYTVDNHELIGRKKGVDNPGAQRTTSWDVVKESPDGTFYFTSLTDTRDEWSEWKDIYASLQGPAFVEKTLPTEWSTPSE